MSFEASFSEQSAARTTVNPTIAKGDALVNDPGRSEGAASKGAIIRRQCDALLLTPAGLPLPTNLLNLFTIGAQTAVAVPHFSVSVVARGSGRSAVLSAAYRHCAKMEYEREARTIDYTRKQGLLHEEFVIAADAPEMAAGNDCRSLGLRRVGSLLEQGRGVRKALRCSARQGCDDCAAGRADSRAEHRARPRLRRAAHHRPGHGGGLGLSRLRRATRMSI